MNTAIGSRRALIKDKTENVAIDLFDLLERLNISISDVTFASIISWTHRAIDEGLIR